MVENFVWYLPINSPHYLAVIEVDTLTFLVISIKASIILDIYKISLSESFKPTPSATEVIIFTTYSFFSDPTSNNPSASEQNLEINSIIVFHSFLLADSFKTLINLIKIGIIIQIPINIDKIILT